MWSTIVNADGATLLSQLFDVGATWARILSLKGTGSLSVQLSVAWCAEARLRSSFGEENPKPDWVEVDCDELGPPPLHTHTHTASSSPPPHSAPLPYSAHSYSSMLFRH